MTITAASVIQRAVGTLQDTTSIRWPVPELVRYLNDGQREIILARPDSKPVNATRALTASTSKQTLPTGGCKLIDIVRNTGGGKEAIRLTSREILDAQIPGWHALTNTANKIAHFMFDPRDPTTFYVYPPAGSASSVELVYAAYPTDIAIPADGTTYADVVGNVDVLDIHANALQDYILYRAYMKDSEYAGNGQRANNHYTAFANSLGIEIKGTMLMAPTTPGNPNDLRRKTGAPA